jgi:hypothetical protein
MALDPNIALNVKGLEVPNPVAQYAQVAQLQSLQNQNQVSQMQLDQMRRDDETLRQIQATAVKNGGPSDLGQIADAYLKSGNPKFVEFGIGLRQKLDEKSQFARIMSMGETPPPAAPVTNALAPTMQPGALGSGTFGIAPEPVNRLAPAPAAPAPVANAMAAPDVSVLRNKRNALLSLGTPQSIAAARAMDADIASISKESPDTQTMRSLGYPLTTEGYRQYQSAKRAPTEIAKLITERDTLPIGDPNRKIYDQAIADLGAQNRIAQQRLAFDQNKFAWEKANPGFELKEAEDGSIVGVNKRTLQAFPVTVGGAAPSTAPMAAGETPTANVIGAPLKGKGKEAPAKFNDTDLQLANLAGSLKEFQDEVGKNLFTGAKFLPSGSDTARMQAKYTALLMGVKDLYTLGALTGPDMSIIESQITNPASWAGKMTTREGFNEQTKVIEDMLKRSTTNLENTYSRTPKAAREALKGLPSGASSGISGATPTNPFGLTIPGVKL